MVLNSFALRFFVAWTNEELGVPDFKGLNLLQTTSIYWVLKLKYFHDVGGSTDIYYDAMLFVANVRDGTIDNRPSG